jgi:hypothetical protein
MFIAREPVLENSFCKHDPTQNTPMNASTPIVSPQGAVCTIVGCDGETAVVKKMESCDEVPFGFLMQEIRTDYNHEYIPWGGMHPRDLGTQRCFVGDPIGVAHHGIYSTNVYDTDVQINAGDFLYASASGTLVKSTGGGYCTVSGNWNNTNPIAVAMNTLTVPRLENGRYLHIKLLI